LYLKPKLTNWDFLLLTYHKQAQKHCFYWSLCTPSILPKTCFLPHFSLSYFYSQI
jgi:hypothetical protein